MTVTVIDTDNLSAIMRQEPVALSHAQEYLHGHSKLSISIVTRFEILRGLYAKNANSQIAVFETLCQSLNIISLTDESIVRASCIYGLLYQQGQLIGDADILIAASCLENGYELATNNTNHFSRIPQLVLQNWLIP